MIVEMLVIPHTIEATISAGASCEAATRGVCPPPSAPQTQAVLELQYVDGVWCSAVCVRESWEETAEHQEVSQGSWSSNWTSVENQESMCVTTLGSRLPSCRPATRINSSLAVEIIHKYERESFTLLLVCSNIRKWTRQTLMSSSWPTFYTGSGDDAHHSLICKIKDPTV